KTLLAIADQEPHTLHELSGITGMGKKRIEQYGEEILRIVLENSK
ncbi:MAG: HRDC domain-containing protein, partial [Bacteroidales bacterium]|nr:HRDC domain-containing protein [Bacteroidales bacterium]